MDAFYSLFILSAYIAATLFCGVIIVWFAQMLLGGIALTLRKIFDNLFRGGGGGQSRGY